MNPPRPLTSGETNDILSAWTPDSKAVLFYSDRNGPAGIFTQQINADEAQAVIIGPQDAEFPRLSADGEWILYQEFPKRAGRSTPVRLMRVPITGGAPQFVLELSRDAIYDCTRAPAGLCVLAEHIYDGKQLTFTAFDALKGRGKVLWTIPKDAAALFTFALSRDGTTIAVARVGHPEIHIRLLSLSGGGDGEVTVKGWSNLSSLGLYWAPDEKGFYCGSGSAQVSTLLYVDLKGNARVLWQKKSGHLIWGIPSPDGRYLAILGQVRKANVWMLEGF
jgi:Tol biopolymer transport system component